MRRAESLLACRRAAAGRVDSGRAIRVRSQERDGLPAGVAAGAGDAGFAGLLVIDEAETLQRMRGDVRNAQRPARSSTSTRLLASTW